MSELVDLAREYLTAEGYRVAPRSRDLLVGRRKTVGDDEELIYVWTSTESGVSLAPRTGPLLGRFREAAEQHPAAPKFLVLESREGLPRDFQDEAIRTYGVKIRAAAQFFDTAFSWEESPTTASALQLLRRRGDDLQSTRVQQPFVDVGTGTQGPDLLPELATRLRSKNRQPSVAVVLAPAGMGKSVLFASLYARLFDAFQEDKRKQILSARPLALLPEYIPRNEAPTIRSILRVFLSGEFARPLNEDVFQWRLSRGLALWLLDGLDEVIALDPSFFDELLPQLIVESEGKSRIVLCLRDALLSTNEPLREFLDEFGTDVTMFRLQPWQEGSKRKYARMRLPAQADQLLSSIADSPTLTSLSATPYYLSLATELFELGRLESAYSEEQLLYAALDGIFQREYDKGLLSEHLTPAADLFEFAEAIAAEDMESGFKGVSAATARDLAEIILSPDIPSEQLEMFSAQLTQLALFTGGDSGELRFAQELLQQYLLGRSLMRALGRPDLVVRRLDMAPLPADWITVPVAAREIREKKMIPGLIELSKGLTGREIAFRNIILLAAAAAEGTADLSGMSFERRDLTGLRFVDLDLSHCSFIGADLTDTRFHACRLEGALMKDAVLHDTAFSYMPEGALHGVDLGDMVRFFSIHVDSGAPITSAEEAKGWFEAQASLVSQVVAPCAAALQLRHLFHKFVRSDGSPRRSWLDRSAAVAGTRFADPDEALKAAIKHDYLHIGPGRPRVERPTGETYAEMVRFVTSLELAPGLRDLIDATCHIPACDHIPST